MNWTDERVERLKRLWAEGLSASQIAAQLGGVSRNAVIGKVHRLCLPGRAKAGGNSSTARAVKRPAAPAAPRPATPTFASRAGTATQTTRTIARPAGATMLKEEIEVEGSRELVFRPANNVVVPLAKHLILTELTERTCKWPVGDPLKDDFYFCGCESPDASPYCNYHAKLAYQPVSERRKVRA